MGLALPEAKVMLLARHLEMVLSANEEFNLTRIEKDDAVRLHVLDSCAAAPALRDAPKGQFADIGSGAGYPGIPLSILTDRPVALVESVGKKAAFLERVVGELCLNATVHGDRAESLALTHPRGFAAVTARAVSSLPSLVELAAPLLASGGLLLCLKGWPQDEELGRGRAAGVLCGMTQESVVELQIPGEELRRTVVTYRRTGKIRASLPRRPGMAQRRPLA